jgi:hypothetical protein
MKIFLWCSASQPRSEVDYLTYRKWAIGLRKSREALLISIVVRGIVFIFGVFLVVAAAVI